MNYLITGATGFLGNNLTRILLDKGHQVSCIVRQNQRPPALSGLEVQPVYADLARPETLNDHLGEFDVLIHTAALIQLGWTRLAESRQVNVVGTLQLAEMCHHRGKRFVYISSVDTLAHAISSSQPVTETQRQPGNPLCSYVVSKREAEQGIQKLVAQGLDAVILHPGFMVGPYDWKPSSGQMMLSVARGLAYLAPGGGCSVVDVRDVAAGVLLAIQRGQAGENYILGGHNVSYLELWQEMARITEVRPPQRKLPNWVARMAGWIGDGLTRLGRPEPLVNSANTAMGQLFHYYSSDKAQRELGYRFGPWQPALADAWEWFGQVGMRPGAKPTL